MRGVLVGIAFVVGCAESPHVALAPVPPTLTPQQRIDAFQALRTHGETLVVTTVCSNRGGCSTSKDVALRLANGVEVWHSEDLAPVIEPTSVTSQAAQRARVAGHETSHWRNVEWLGFGVGVAGLGVGFQTEDVMLGGAIMGTGMIIALIGMVSANSAHDREVAADHEAFASYDHALAARLQVCASGMSLVPCEQLAPSLPATPASTASGR